jgi:hypothetical protein
MSLKKKKTTLKLGIRFRADKRRIEGGLRNLISSHRMFSLFYSNWTGYGNELCDKKRIGAYITCPE